MSDVRILDGARFDDFEGFCAEFSRAVLGGAHRWNGSFDALDDILAGGFGTPDGRWTLRWTNAGHSRRALGHVATAARLRALLTTCHPTNVPVFRSRLEAAERGEGPTLFDEIVGILREHGEGGSQAPEDDFVVDLEVED